MKSEEKFSNTVQGRLCKQFSVQSFESAAIQSVPDLYLLEQRSGASIWVELKVEKENRISFMPGQVPWLEKHIKNGGLAYVLVLHPGGFDGIVRLYPASKARWLSNVKMDKFEEGAKAINLAAIACGQLGAPSLWEDVCRAIKEDCEDKWGSKG